MPFHTFLFDLDGTLIDHFVAIHRAYVHTLGAMGLPTPTPAQTRSAVGGGLENAMRKFVPETRLAEAMRIYREYWNRTLLDDVVLLPGARELLESLRARGDRLAVLTNKLGDSSRLICAHLGIAALLDAVVGAQDTPWLKPQPEIVAHVLTRLGAERPGALLVGDSPYDVEAGRNAGMPVWCVTTGTHDAAALRAAGAERIFGSLAEMGAALLVT
jgi:phosphoglycolate phosphatase